MKKRQWWVPGPIWSNKSLVVNKKSYQLLRDRENYSNKPVWKNRPGGIPREDQIKIDFKNMLAKRDEERVVALQLAAEKAAAEAARPVPEPVVLPSEPETEQAEEGKAVENAKRKWLNIRFKSVLSEMVC